MTMLQLPHQEAETWERQRIILSRSMTCLDDLLEVLHDLHPKGYERPVSLISSVDEYVAHASEDGLMALPALLEKIATLACESSNLFPSGMSSLNTACVVLDSEHAQTKRLLSLGSLDVGSVSGMSREISLSPKQVSCLLANAFFGTFHHPSTCHFNFRPLYLLPWAKGNILALLLYFSSQSDNCGGQSISFRRILLQQCPDWADLSLPIAPFVLHQRRRNESPPRLEEEGAAMLQVIATTRNPGAGVLKGRLHYEDVRMGLTNPELLCLLFLSLNAPLENAEAMVVCGCRRVGTYTVERGSAQFSGFHDFCPDNHLDDVVMIDPLPYPADQYTMESVMRELNKALSGYVLDSQIPCAKVAAGKWGSGLTTADASLKFVIQWLAASAAGKELNFFPFEDDALAAHVAELGRSLRFAKDVTIGSVCSALKDYLALRDRILTTVEDEECEMLSAMPNAIEFVVGSVNHNIYQKSPWRRFRRPIICVVVVFVILALWSRLRTLRLP